MCVLYVLHNYEFVILHGMTVGQRANLGDKKMADFLKQILSTLFQEKPIEIGDGWKAL